MKMRLKYQTMEQLSEQHRARVYFALWPSTTERNLLGTWQEQLQRLCGGRVMRHETLHNTLVFIGEVEPCRLESLQLAAQEVNGHGFELRLDVARYWGHNNIVYAAPARVPEQLRKLVSALEKSLLRHGFKFEQREYKPHVTLMRNAHWTDAPLPEMQTVSWQIRDFALIEAVLQDGRRNYRVLARFPLGLNKPEQ